MRVTIGNTISVENPSSDVIRWCNKNLVVSNPEYITKSRMSLYIGNTPQTLCLYEKQGDQIVLPFGTLRSLMPLFEEAEVTTTFEQSKEVDYHCTVPLYDYQEEAVTALMQSHYGILQSRAGSGKTQIGIALVARLKRRTLWLTHTKDLMNQSMERAKLYMDESLIGTITEGKVNIGKGITFATVQTMCRLNLAAYMDFWDVVIVDECHRCSGTPTAMTQFFKVLNSLRARHKYGLSATVHRSDGMIGATYALLGEVVYIVPDEDVGDRVMKVGIFPVGTGIQLGRKCLNTDGTINYTNLISYLCESKERNTLIASDIAENAQYPSLILSDRLQHLQDLMALLPPTINRNAVMIDGKMTSKAKKAEREQALEDMRTGKKKYLFATYSLAKEGLDIPRLERLYMTTPQTDFTVVTQSIGRIARTFPYKEQPLCFDYVDDIKYLFKAYKKRCTTYKKNGCYFVSEGEVQK